MTLTKASQKRSRSRDEDSEDVLPRTKRREYNFDSSHTHGGLHEDQVDGAGEPHHSQAASTSTSPLATSPLAGSTASHHQHRLPHQHNSADITSALHNTHLDRHGCDPRHSPSPPTPASLPSCHHHHHHHHQQHHPLLLKDAGILPPSHQHHPSLGALPDVVHETSESYYSHVNRLLCSAHFERLKRVKDPSQSDAFQGSAFN